MVQLHNFLTFVTRFSWKILYFPFKTSDIGTGNVCSVHKLKTATAGDSLRCCTWFRRSAPSPSAAPLESASKTGTRSAVRFCRAAVWRQHVQTARLPCSPWSRHLLLAAPLPGDGSNTWCNVKNKPGWINLSQSYNGHIFSSYFVLFVIFKQKIYFTIQNIIFNRNTE